MDKVIIFDTTLRDGEQAPGYSMNVSEKVNMARQLERLGADVIEAGFAASSTGDLEAVKAVSAAVDNAIVASLSRARREDIDLAYEAVKDAKRPRIHIFLATSPIHIKHKLKMTENEVLERIYDSVSYAKTLIDDVQFSCEDATRSERKFLLKAVETAIEAGAKTVNIPDTVGYSEPGETEDLFKYVKNNAKGIERVILSTHNHDDLGLAVANTLAAVKAGARQIEGTINGIGERAGNAALEEIIMGIKTRRDLYGVYTNVNTKEIYRTSKLLSSIVGASIPSNKAIVGRNAFKHEAGIHQHGMLASRDTYEIIDPKEVGIVDSEIVLGKHSGRHAVEQEINNLGYELTESDIKDVYEKFIELADKKKTVSQKDLEAILTNKKKVTVGNGYRLVNYSIMTEGNKKAKAGVTVTREGDAVSNTAEGDGPVAAAFNAFNGIAGRDFKLIDFQIQSVTEGEDALGEAIIRLMAGTRTTVGRGVSTDIIEAALLGYINAVNKLIFM